jgi:hypothetical protein
MNGLQPKLHVVLRIAAGIAVVCWLGAVALCNVESALGWHDCSENSHADASSNQNENPAQREGLSHSADSDGDAHHSLDPGGHSEGSNHHDGGEGFCCSTLKAIVQTSNSAVLSIPTLHAVAFLCAVVEAHDLALLTPETASGRHGKCCERVFKPEVCPSSANRSHAPPAFV